VIGENESICLHDDVVKAVYRMELQQEVFGQGKCAEHEFEIFLKARENYSICLKKAFVNNIV
jgi:hypothetical protein